MRVKLGEVATYVNGYAFKPSDWSDKGRPIIRIQDLTGNSYQANRYEGDCDPKYNVYAGDVLISWSASLGVYVWDGEEAVLNQHIFKVVFDKAEVDKSFFIHQVERILNNASNEAHGATMKHLTKPVFDALPFNLPAIEEQQKIAAVLDKVSGLIAMRKKQLQKLDDLVKARFIELFGEDIKKSSLTISDVAEETTVGIANSATHAYTDSGVVMLRNQNIRINRLDDSDLICIEPEFAAKYRNKALQENDILITRTGANVGMACVVPAKYAGCQTFTTLILRLRKDIDISPIFVCHYINSPIGKDFIDENKIGGAQPNFGAKQLATMPIAVPLKERQAEFDLFVEQTDKSKLTIQQSLDKLELMKKALMQKYFG